MSNKELKEKEFHNDSFATNKRKSVDKYYLTARKSQKKYESILNGFAPDSKVLEYGCGTGSYSFLLAKKNCQVIGIDISDVGVQMANEKAIEQSLQINLSFMVMNAEKLEFPNNSFDFICGTGIIHHLDTKKAYAEIYRVLKPGGRAIFSEPLGHNPLINLYRKLTPTIRTEDEHPLTMRELDETKKTFAQTNFHHFHLTTLAAAPFVNSFIFKPLLSVLEVIDKTLFTLLPFMKRFSWVVIIELKK